MNILMTGCDTDSVGRWMRTKLEEQGHKVVGLGLDGPEYRVDVHRCSLSMACDKVDMIFEGAAERFDCVFNHGGMTILDWIEDDIPANFEFLWKVNCFIPYLTCRALVKQVKRELEHGFEYAPTETKIVNTCTIGTSISLRSSSGYISSKGALESLTKNLSKELAGRYPITVLGIAPGGLIDTPMTETEKQGHMRTRNWTREQAEAYALTSNLGRKGTWEELWAVVDFAINQAPEYMTGSIIKMPNGLGVS